MTRFEARLRGTQKWSWDDVCQTCQQHNNDKAESQGPKWNVISW